MTTIRTTLVLLILTCGVYPFLVWGIGQVAFRDEANGSLVVRHGRVIGSTLIAQPFTSARYFHPRPSAVDFNAQASGGSNLGPTSKKLRNRIENASGPVDAYTTSASGLDPHISPANAQSQIARVARTRGVDPTRVRSLVEQHVEGRFLGIYGEPRVNVLVLNLALDEELQTRSR